MTLSLPSFHAILNTTGAMVVRAFSAKSQSVSFVARLTRRLLSEQNDSLQNSTCKTTRELPQATTFAKLAVQKSPRRQGDGRPQLFPTFEVRLWRLFCDPRAFARKNRVVAKVHKPGASAYPCTKTTFAKAVAQNSPGVAEPNAT